MNRIGSHRALKVILFIESMFAGAKTWRSSPKQNAAKEIRESGCLNRNLSIGPDYLILFVHIHELGFISC